MKPHLVTNEAVKGIAGNVALRMNKSESYVYSLGEDPEKDRYTRFVLFWLAVAAEDLSRAGMFVTDLASRFEAMERRHAGRPDTSADAHALSTLCSKLIDNIILEGRGRATGEDVLSSARKLHAALSAFISAGLSGEVYRGGEGSPSRADTREAGSRANLPAASSLLADEGEQPTDEAAPGAGALGARLVGVGHASIGANGYGSQRADERQ